VLFKTLENCYWANKKKGSSSKDEDPFLADKELSQHGDHAGDGRDDHSDEHTRGKDNDDDFSDFAFGGIDRSDFRFNLDGSWPLFAIGHRIHLIRFPDLFHYTPKKAKKKVFFVVTDGK